jgi:hypothetical protein
MAFMEVKPTDFLTREERFDAKAFFVPVTGFIGQIENGDQENRFTAAFLPSGQRRDWAT